MAVDLHHQATGAPHQVDARSVAVQRADHLIVLEERGELRIRDDLAVQYLFRLARRVRSAGDRRQRDGRLALRWLVLSGRRRLTGRFGLGIAGRRSRHPQAPVGNRIEGGVSREQRGHDHDDARSGVPRQPLRAPGERQERCLGPLERPDHQEQDQALGVQRQRQLAHLVGQGQPSQPRQLSFAAGLVDASRRRGENPRDAGRGVGDRRVDISFHPAVVGFPGGGGGVECRVDRSHGACQRGGRLRELA